MSEKRAWLDCVRWLEQCGVLSPQQIASIDDIQQLASFLRDGVLLCHLANKLHPNSIDFRSFSQKPKNSQFLCKKNVDAFLFAAKYVFGLKDKDLFTRNEIFEMTNFGKVLVTLSKLSEIEAVEKLGIRPFYCEMDTIYTIMEDKIDDEIYTSSSHYDTKLSVLDESEDIYDSLVYKKNSYVNVFLTEDKSDKCINELIGTEKNYLEVLKTIKNDFQDPLKELIDNSQFSTIFLNLENILQLHRNFYADLLGCKSSGMKIASCFINYKMQMTIYAEFCAHLPVSITEVSFLCTRNSAANELIERAGVESKVKLHDILTIPFQRFFKYPLLIKEIIKNYINEGKELDLIEKWREALASVEDLAQYINELTGGKDSLLEMESILKSFEGGLKMGGNTQLKDYGRRLFDGEFSYKSQKSRSFEFRHIFLFEKLMMLCKPTKKKKVPTATLR